MRAMADRTAGPIKTKLGIGTHVDPVSVLVKVKVIYVCVRYNRIHACATWRITMNHARSSISRGSGAVAGATWWVLIKILTEAHKHRENSSAKHNAPDRGQQGRENPSGGVIIQLVYTKRVLFGFIFTNSSSNQQEVMFQYGNWQKSTIRELSLTSKKFRNPW